MDEQDYNGGAGEFHVRLLSYTCLPGVIITLCLLHLVWKKKLLWFRRKEKKHCRLMCRLCLHSDVSLFVIISVVGILVSFLKMRMQVLST